MCLIPIEIPRNSLVVINDEIYLARYVSEDEIREMMMESPNRERIDAGIYLLSGYKQGNVMSLGSYQSMRTYRLDMFDYKKTLKVDIIIQNVPCFMQVNNQDRIIELLNIFSEPSDVVTNDEKVVYAQQLKDFAQIINKTQ